jgi:hypothetical protein
LQVMVVPPIATFTIAHALAPTLTELPLKLRFAAPGAVECLVLGDGVEFIVDGQAVEAELSELVSPGLTVDFGERTFHLQLLRPHGILVGPLLVFEAELPIPCLSVGDDGAPQAGKAQLPVFLTSTELSPRARAELEGCLALAAKLLQGGVRPGLDDDTYFSSERARS